jgi:DNA-binding CsgD family transcriptional regulator
MEEAALERGRAAYADRRWNVCVESLRAADAEEPLSGDDLRLLGLSLHMTGDDEASMAVLERAHRLALDEEHWAEAAETAFWFGFILINSDETTRGTAWLTRSRALAAEHHVPGSIAALPDAAEARGLVMAGRTEEGLALASACARTGRAEGNANLEVLGRLGVGWALLRQGRRAEALAAYDDVMLTVSWSNQVYPTVAGLAYCAVISACMSVLDIRRAREWTGALSEWCEAQSGLVPYRGQCLVHRSQLMAMQGDWVGALDEARSACARLGGPAIGDAWYQLGEVQRLQGRYQDAEDAYRRANSLGRQPEPGLALMRLEQGRLDEAVTTFRRLYAEPSRIDRADILAGFVAAVLAAGDVDAARTATDELAADAEASPVHQGRAAEARGAVLLAEQDPAGALAHLRQALGVWTTLEMPYDAARVRVLIGDACRGLGDETAACLEHDAARETFVRLGAGPALARLDATTPGHGGLTAREVEVLRLVAAGHTNRTVATELVLSEKTVARHLSNIYTKLGIGSRSAATAYAYDHHLV